MNRPVRLSVGALRDRDRLAAFLIGKSPGAAARSLIVIEQALRSLGQFPEVGRSVAGGFREWTIRFGRDGYVVRYRVDASQVFITRIFHTLENR